MSSADPGDGSDIQNLQETFSQQQAKISALKKLVRDADHGKSATKAQEKVRSIAQRLTHLKLKASRSRQTDKNSSESEEIQYTGQPSLNVTNETQQGTSAMSYLIQPSNPSTSAFRARSETPGSEKIQLLRLQMEQNRQKMAEREHNNRGIEEMVTQLKAKFDSTQLSLEKSSELGKSIGDLSLISSHSRSFAKSSSDLSILSSSIDKERIKSLQNKIHVLENKLKEKVSESINTEKIQEMENKLLDLEESLKEKECIIEARTQAVSLMSENLSLKGKNTVELLEETKQEMLKMQKNFIKVENDMKSEIEVLKMEMDEKNNQIANFSEKNSILETARFDLTIKNSELERKILDVVDYSTKIDELNKLNQNLQHRISDLENQKYEIITDDEVALAKQATFDHSDAHVELCNRIKVLEQDNKDLNGSLEDALKQLNFTTLNDSDIVIKYQELETVVKEQNKDLEEHKSKINSLEELLTEKIIEYNVLNANFSVLQSQMESSGPKMLFSKSTDEDAELEILKLRSQLDEGNKGMIKMKLKIKQLQKQIDNFRKTTDVNQQILRLTDEVQLLQQKIVELEEEKGNLQLRLVNEDTVHIDSELEDRIKILEQTCQNQTAAIKLLEEQKSDMSQIQQDTKRELVTLKERIHDQDQQESVRVISHFDSIELEEKIEKFTEEKKYLELQLKDLSDLNVIQNLRLETLDDEKNDLNNKLDRYIAENIALLDKIEKLSLEKASSNESIEIVEGFTQQDKLEIEEYQKLRDEDHSDKQKNINNTDLSESLKKLREECSELMQKVELFTIERREVLERMELLLRENQKFSKNIIELQNDKDNLQEKLQTIERKKNVNKEYKENLEVMEASHTISFDEENYRVSLKNLENEFEFLKKTKDKNAKLKISKKIFLEAKNVHDLLINLIEEHKTVIDNCNSLRSELKIANGQFITSETVIENLKDVHTENEIIKGELNACRHILKTKEEMLIENENIKKQEIEKLKIQNLKYWNKITDQNEIIDKLNQTNSESNEKLKEFDNIIKTQSNEFSQLRHELDTRSLTVNNGTDILKALIAEQKQQLINAFTDHENEIARNSTQIDEYKKQIKQLSEDLNKTKENNFNSVEVLKYKEELAYKQETIDALNAQITELYKSMEDISSQMIISRDNFHAALETKTSEINNLRVILMQNEKMIENLKVQLKISSTEIENLKAMSTNTSDDEKLVMEKRITEMENCISDLDQKNREQLDKLKKYAANLKKKVMQCNELEDKLSIANITLNKTELYEQEINCLKKEIDSISYLLEEKKRLCGQLEQTISQLEQENGINRSEMSKLSISLQQSGDSDNGVQLLINEIDKFKQELSDKIGIILGLEISIENYRDEVLRKDRGLNLFEEEIEELQANIRERNATIEINNINLDALNEKVQKLELMQNEVEMLSIDQKSKNIKIEKCKAVLKEKNKEIQKLKEKLDQFEKIDRNTLELEYELKSLKEAYNHDVESLKQNIINVQCAHKTTFDGFQAKLQEKLLYIETIEIENLQLKEKTNRLQDGIRQIDERRMSLERQANLLGNELEEKTNMLNQNEDVFIQRLAALEEHDENIRKHLVDTQNENTELNENLKDLSDQNGELLKKIVGLESHINFLDNEKFQEFEKNNLILNQQNEALQIELKKIHNEFEKKFFDKHAEIDELELELSAQLQRVEMEKKTIQEGLEKSNDKNIELLDEIVRLKDNVNNLELVKTDLERDLTWTKLQNENLSNDNLAVHELRTQLGEHQKEIENLRLANLNIIHSQETETNILRKQITKLELVNLKVGQNQTDDQVMLENENKKLREFLKEKELEIHEYQQRTQMQKTTSSMENLNDQPTHRKQPLPMLDLDNLRISNEEINKMQKEISDVKNDNWMKQTKITELESSLKKVEQTVKEKHREIEALNSILLQIRKNLLTDTTSEINENLEIAQECLYLLQQNSNLKNNELEHYEINEEKQQRRISTLQCQLEKIELYVDELEEKLKNSKRVRKEPMLSEEKKIEEAQISQREKVEENFELQTNLPSFNSSIFFGEPETSSFDEAITTLPINKMPTTFKVDDEFQKTEYMKKMENEISFLEKDRQNLSIQLNEQNKIIESLRFNNNQLNDRIRVFETTLSQLSNPLISIKEHENISLPSFSSSTFFDTGSSTLFDQGTPVMEEIIEPKKSYLCGSEKKLQKKCNMNIVLDDQSWGWEAEPSRDSSIEQVVISKENVEVQTEFDTETEGMEIKLREFENYISNLEEKCKQISIQNDNILKQLYEKTCLLEEFKDSNVKNISELEVSQKEQIILEYQKQIGDLEAKYNQSVIYSETISQQLQEQNKTIDVLKASNLVYFDKIKNLESQSKTDKQNMPQSVSFNSSMFFDEKLNLSDEFDFAGKQSVVEELVVSDKAYVYGPEKQQTTDQEDVIPSEEEGWGWGSEDVVLEEQHQILSVSKFPPVASTTESNIKMAEYEDKIDELELEKKRLKDEVIELQVKSGKLLKKLKEYKNKNEQISTRESKTSSIESDLDLAIQDELNLQIKHLERKIKDIRIENEKYYLEKESLLKRIDVLTSANDRMTEMKERQDNEVGNYQYQLKELKIKLQQLQEWEDDSYNASNLNKELIVPTSNTNIPELEKQICELKAEINDLRVDNDEYQALLEEEKSNNKICECKLEHVQLILNSSQEKQLEELNSLKNDIIVKNNEIQNLRARIFVLETEIYESVSKIDVLTVESTNIKIHLDKLNQEHRHKIDENNNLSRELTTIIAKNNELSNEIERMKTASLFHGSEFSGLSSSAIDFQKIEEHEQRLQMMTAQLQYKDSEILHLNQKIEDVVREDQTQSLVQEILNKNQEINLLKTQVQSLENDKTELENNLSLQLTQQLLPLKNEEVNNLRVEINVRNKKITDLEKQLLASNNQKCDLENELKILNEQVVSNLTFEDRVKETVLQLDMKNIEIMELKNTLDQLKMNKSNLSEQKESANNIERQLDQKWREYLNERENEFSKLEQSLKHEINNLKTQNNENTVMEENKPMDSPIVKKMEEALESQEIEIVTLKEQLAIRSAEYASLATQLDPYAQRSTSSMGSIIKASKTNSSSNIVLNDDTVPRGELDLALYMLHQRDMRCEELTLELISLLEERDTLQLKLSNSIRQIEDIRRKPALSEVSDTDSGDVNISIDNTPEKTEVGKSTETPLQQLSREKDAFALKTKLTELQAVSHSRDKTFREDREKRQRQMSQLQKDISNIPSEAVAQLVGTDYTLSRTSQSPSSVLINWLMGRSTPKEPQS